MIKRFREFIREFVEQNLDYISARMQELQDEISNLSEVESGSSLMYNWYKGEDEYLVINFTIDDIPYRYELDLKKDTPFIVKEYIDNQLSFEEEVSDEEDGLFLIEKKIRDILGLYESYTGDYDSSLTEEEVKEVTNRIRKFAKIEVIDNTADVEGLVEELQEALSNYDKETIDLVIDTTLFGDDSDSWEDWAVEQIISTGDKIMSKHGTEPMQLLNAYNDVFIYLKKYFRWQDSDEVFEAKRGRPKSQRYKGKKIPGKYLTKNPKAMKKEIDTYRGKKEYKKDWDADYKSGKGGKGKRVKTKKSASTLAYERMYKNKEK